VLSDNKHRSGLILLGWGVIFIGSSAARVATGWAPGPGWLLFEIATCAVGLVLFFWGWSRLRRARLAHPELSWWGLLHIDLIMIGFVLLIIARLASMPPEQRNILVRSVNESADWLRIACGR
jgi:hypothetical protein